MPCRTAPVTAKSTEKNESCVRQRKTIRETINAAVLIQNLLQCKLSALLVNMRRLIAWTGLHFSCLLWHFFAVGVLCFTRYKFSITTNCLISYIPPKPYIEFIVGFLLVIWLVLQCIQAIVLCWRGRLWGVSFGSRIYSTSRQKISYSADSFLPSYVTGSKPCKTIRILLTCCSGLRGHHRCRPTSVVVVGAPALLSR